MAQDVLVVAHLSSTLCGNDCVVCMDPQLASGAFLSTGAALRRMAASDLLSDATCGVGGKRPRSPSEHAHGRSQSSFSFSLLQHELPHRTSHVSDGAVPRSSEIARASGTVPPSHLLRPAGCFPRNCPHVDPPVQRCQLLRVAGTAGDESANAAAGGNKSDYASSGCALCLIARLPGFKSVM